MAQRGKIRPGGPTKKPNTGQLQARLAEARQDLKNAQDDLRRSSRALRLTDGFVVEIAPLESGLLMVSIGRSENDGDAKRFRAETLEEIEGLNSELAATIAEYRAMQPPPEPIPDPDEQPAPEA